MTIVLIATPSLVINDAVSNDVFLQQQELSRIGYNVHLFAEFFDDRYADEIVGHSIAEDLLKNPDHLLIYHHSVGWDLGLQLLQKSRSKVIMKYHNITPAPFYQPYERNITKVIHRGRQQTKTLIDSGRIDFFTSDSPFNESELIALGVPKDRSMVVPPYTKFTDFAQTPLISEDFQHLLDGRKNILFVGRVVPNKGLQHLIRVIDRYVHHFGSEIRLNIVGGFFDNAKYLQELSDEVNTLRLSDHVHFLQKLPFANLHTLFACSHAFLVTSEHEGFCVPVLEAQFHQLPVVALKSSAVTDTVGSGQMIFDKMDYDLFATALHKVCYEEPLRYALTQAGRKNLERFATESITQRLHEAIKEVQP